LGVLAVRIWIQGSAGILRRSRRRIPVTEQGPIIADRTPIFALFGANAVSQVGNMMIMVAVPWFVLETTGSAAKVGLTAAAVGVGAVVPAVLGGPLVDRLGFRRASVLTDLASAATVAAIPLLYLAGALAFWQLLVLVFVLSSLNSNGDSARFALVPALARRATMPIERANAADRAIVRLGAVVGATFAWRFDCPHRGLQRVVRGCRNLLGLRSACSARRVLRRERRRAGPSRARKGSPGS
jgi:predicted MFS family arabinose efflux permease